MGNENPVIIEEDHIFIYTGAEKPRLVTSRNAMDFLKELLSSPKLREYIIDELRHGRTI